MPDLIQPSWGRSLGEGISGGFDRAINGMLKGQQLKMELERQRRLEEKDRMDFLQSTGYDEPSIMEGQRLQNQPTPLAMSPQQSALAEEYNSFKNMMKQTAGAKREKIQAEARLAGSNASFMDFLQGGAGGRKPDIVDGGDGNQYVRTVTKSGVHFAPVSNQKGNEGAVSATSDAISSAGAIDKYYNALDSTGKSNGELFARFAQSGLPGSQMFNPSVTQAESQVLPLILSSRGGKTLSEGEQRIYSTLLKSPSYGPQERANARIELKKMFGRNIRNAAAANLLGGSKDQILGQLRGLESQWGINPGVRSTPDVRFGQLEKLGLGEDEIHQMMYEEGYR